MSHLIISKLKTEYKSNPLGLSTASPRLSWEISSDQSGVLQTAFRVVVASSSEALKSGKNLIWDSEKRLSDQSIHVAYEGALLSSSQRVYWQVQVWDNHGNVAFSEEEAFWEMGLLHVSDWKAHWIAQPWENDLKTSAPCPYFRKEFVLHKEVRAARIYVTALGLYELELNGTRVGDELFTPGWTNYHQRLQYQVYDVTAQIRSGGNVIGAVLGDGWYRGHLGWWENNRNGYGEQLALLLQVKVDYVDGTHAFIGSDASWKAATGAILKSDIYNGETYDARSEHLGWSGFGFDDSDWVSAVEMEHSKEILVASEGAQVRATQELVPVALLTTPKGEEVFDLGQNMVGWVRLQVEGTAGTVVALKFAEVLDQEGNFYTDNLRNIECTDRYVLKGTGVEVFEPHFTFHGFRYVQVCGYPGSLSLEDITGIVVHSDMELTGSFECSDPLVNQLQHNIQWGQRGNFLDVPTDCPQRDERLGWTGDAQVFAPTASFNFNTASFFTKWLKDLASEQRADGSVPWVVPNTIEDGGGTGWSDGFGATGWADAAVIIPWTLYQSYGDQRILENQFDSMKAWVDYMARHAGNEYIFDYGFHFGDWLSFATYESYRYHAPDYGYAGATTDKALIATAYFYRSAELLRKSAEIIGKTDVAEYLGALTPKIKSAWNEEFMTKSGRLVSGTQAAYAIGLCFGLVNNELETVIAKRLADDVCYFGHLTTGFLGTPVLNLALSDFGYPDLAYQLLHNERYPSWLYPITKGATTIWERWDGIRSDGSFQTTGMNSFNHYAYGAIGDWLYSRVVGIRMDEQQPGYKRIIFHPQPGGKLAHANASLTTMYGRVSAKWRVEEQMVYVLEIPPNTSGKVILECDALSRVTLNGRALEKNAQCSMLESNANQVSFELGSGQYTIAWPLTKGFKT